MLTTISRPATVAPRYEEKRAKAILKSVLLQNDPTCSYCGCQLFDGAGKEDSAILVKGRLSCPNHVMFALESEDVAPPAQTPVIPVRKETLHHTPRPKPPKIDRRLIPVNADPCPEEIAAACLEIQSGWSDDERRRRWEGEPYEMHSVKGGAA